MLLFLAAPVLWTHSHATVLCIQYTMDDDQTTHGFPYMRNLFLGWLHESIRAVCSVLYLLDPS